MGSIHHSLSARYIHQDKRSFHMKNDIPSWALTAVTSKEQGFAKEAHRQGRMQIKWPDINALRSWAKQQGWPTPLFGFEKAFIAKILETEENFDLAIEKSGIEIIVPRKNYTISGERIL